MVKLDIHRYRGDTDPIVIKVTKDRAPVDLTGAVFVFSVSATSVPTEAVYELQLTGVPDLLTSVVTFTPTALEADMVGTFYFDIQMTTGDVIKTIAYGKLRMSQDITK